LSSSHLLPRFLFEETKKMGNCNGGQIEPQKTKNTRHVGWGGDLKEAKGKVRVCVVAFDYKGYGADHQIPPLTATADGRRFADMAKVCGAEVKEYYDTPESRVSVAFPEKDVILEEWRRIGAEMTSDDVFVFFFAGHGLQKSSDGPNADEARDDVMLFMKPDGTPVGLVDDTVAETLAEAFLPEHHILFVTDCCHCGTICDLSSKKLNGRPIVHLAAVKDSQSAQDLGDGGAFTCALLETLEAQVAVGNEQDGLTRDMSVPDVFNNTFDKFSGQFKNQDFTFETTKQYDADTFRWPLVPPAGWTVSDPLDNKKPCFGLC